MIGKDSPFPMVSIQRLFAIKISIMQMFDKVILTQCAQ
jgi:hypothetical protein